MTLLTGFFTYLLIWWVCLFVMLPLGVTRNDKPEMGHDSGAPLKAEIGKKLAYTTLMACLIWGTVFILFETGILNYREMVSIK